MDPDADTDAVRRVGTASGEDDRVAQRGYPPVRVTDLDADASNLQSS
jgi:hypothetical protein